MKVGVIVTDLFRDTAADLCGDKIDTDLITIQHEPSLKTYREIASFMNDSRGYDLFHNIGSAVPLLFSGFVETPVLTTIYRKPEAEELNIYLSAWGNCFFVAAPSVEDIPGLTMLGCVDTSRGDPGKYYLPVYEQIIRMCTREDHRPWGYYEVLTGDRADHKVKRITVWPEKRLSLQMHNKRKEHWIIISGRARVTLGKDEIALGPSGSIDIPLGMEHRIENIGDEPLVFIEIQQGAYFGEDDIIRLDDDFGRT